MKNIKSLFNKEFTGKILFFFNENPNCIDTVKGISLWIGGDENSIQKALNQLVKEGVITSHKTSSTTAYAYTNNKEIVKNIEKYIKKSKGL
jgi:predicted transcriptional regulator